MKPLIDLINDHFIAKYNIKPEDDEDAWIAFMCRDDIRREYMQAYDRYRNLKYGNWPERQIDILDSIHERLGQVIEMLSNGGTNE